MGLAGLELTFTGEREFVDAVAEEFEADDVEVVEQADIDDPTELRLDLGAVAAVVAIVSQTFFDGPLVPTLFRVLRRTKPQRIKISSPFREITFEPSQPMTEDELRAALRRLAEL